jgi:hypothetical protein
MSLFRLNPTSHLPSTSVGPGRCAACSKRIGLADDAVWIYGEVFHRDCAFYRPRGASNGRMNESRRS